MPLGVELLGRALANRSKRGLYAGRNVLFGNKVSEDGGNRTRRRWLPNVQNKRIYSELLDRMIPLRVTTGAMRNIDKAGGLDAYVYKIEGTHEDSDKAAQVRDMLRLERERREQQRLRQISQANKRAKEEARAARLKLMPDSAAAALEQDSSPATPPS